MSFTHKTISNFLTELECKQILDFSLKNLVLSPAEIINTTTDGVDNLSRKSDIVFYPYYKKFPFLLEKTSKLLFNTLNVKGFNLDYKNSEFQFTQYNVGDFFNWHKDVYGDKITEFDRYCSIVIQLNNEYKNGDLELKVDEDKIVIVEKGIGNLTIFLSDMEHRVNTITSGNRYTLVNWVGLIKEINYKKTLL
jgi:Rps23 Pro-64 3,4-dihydroxylase Tpa1-like proline 4-hydroxylase